MFILSTVSLLNSEANLSLFLNPFQWQISEQLYLLCFFIFRVKPWNKFDLTCSNFPLNIPASFIFTFSYFSVTDPGTVRLVSRMVVRVGVAYSQHVTIVPTFTSALWLYCRAIESFVATRGNNGFFCMCLFTTSD